MICQPSPYSQTAADSRDTEPAPPPHPSPPAGLGPLNALGRESFLIAESKGFHPTVGGVTGPDIPTHVSNIHGEVSELWEAHRKGVLQEPCTKVPELTNLEEELADIIIRAVDLGHQFGVDIDRAVYLKGQYNRTRPYMHGKRA